tara:strand:+ start:1639 stop:2202 length:564 start_codon:yes stop_codon:yes gene_type:complete
MNCSKYNIQTAGYKKKSKKNKKYKKHKNKARGSRKSFRDKKVIISQLSQLNIPHDLRQETLKNFSASVIQDRFNEKYFNRLKEVLQNVFTRQEIIYYMILIRNNIYEINSEYNFDNKKIPNYLLDIKHRLALGFKHFQNILFLQNNDENLKKELKKVGYRNLSYNIGVAITYTRDMLSLLDNINNIE